MFELFRRSQIMKELKHKIWQVIFQAKIIAAMFTFGTLSLLNILHSLNHQRKSNANNVRDQMITQRLQKEFKLS